MAEEKGTPDIMQTEETAGQVKEAAQAAGEETEETGAQETAQTEETAQAAEECGETAQESEEAAEGCGEEAQECEACGEAAQESGEEAEEPAREKKGFFGRKKEKKDKRDAKIEELTDLARRQLAEFDNFRKRTEKEKAAMFEVGAKSVVEKILPVVDNFERGLAGADPDDQFAVGMQMIYKQLMTTLEQLEVRPIEAVGKPFDPDFHNAVMHVEDESVGESIVVEELQKGYMYRDSVVRHSMVKVAN